MIGKITKIPNPMWMFSQRPQQRRIWEGRIYIWYIQYQRLFYRSSISSVASPFPYFILGFIPNQTQVTTPHTKSKSQNTPLFLLIVAVGTHYLHVAWQFAVPHQIPSIHPCDLYSFTYICCTSDWRTLRDFVSGLSENDSSFNTYLESLQSTLPPDLPGTRLIKVSDRTCGVKVVSLVRRHDPHKSPTTQN